jgi:hypothetical protein
MRMRPISSRVKPENDDPSIVEPIEATTSAQVGPLIRRSSGRRFANY